MGSAAGGPGQAPPGLNVWFAGSFFLGLSLWFPSYLLYLPLMPASMVFPPAAPLFLYPLGSPGAPPLDPVGGAAPLAVRKGRCASPPRRLPSTPLLTGLPPRFFRHWRRSAPAVRKGRCASPLKRLPSTPLLTGLPPRFFRHWRRSAPAVRNGRWASPLKRLPSTPLLTGLPPRFFRHWRRSAPAVPNGRCASPLKRLPSTPLLTGLPPRFFRHWRRSAPPPFRF